MRPPQAPRRACALWERGVPAYNGRPGKPVTALLRDGLLGRNLGVARAYRRLLQTGVVGSAQRARSFDCPLQKPALGMLSAGGKQ